MEKITFKNGQTPAINDTTLNQMQDNIEKSIEDLKKELNETAQYCRTF